MASPLCSSGRFALWLTTLILLVLSYVVMLSYADDGSSSVPAYVKSQPVLYRMGLPPAKRWYDQYGKRTAMSADGKLAALGHAVYPSNGYSYLRIFAFQDSKQIWKRVYTLKIPTPSHAVNSSFELLPAFSDDGKVLVVTRGEPLAEESWDDYSEDGDYYRETRPVTERQKTRPVGRKSLQIHARDDSYHEYEYEDIPDNTMWIFKRVGNTNTWKQAQDPVPLQYVTNRAYPCISGDGSRIVLPVSRLYGRPGQDYNVPVPVFDKQANGSYLQSADITITLPLYDTDELSIDGDFIAQPTLSRDGFLLALGYYADNWGWGTVWVFRQNNTVASQWTLVDKLTASQGRKESFFGMGVSLSHDGSFLAVSARAALLTFRKNGTNYQLDSTVDLPDQETCGGCERQVKLVRNATRLLVMDFQMGAWVFDLVGLTWNEAGSIARFVSLERPYFDLNVVTGISADGNKVLATYYAHVDKNVDEYAPNHIQFLASIPPKQCQPAPQVTRANCKARIKICKNLLQSLKWTGRGCEVGQSGTKNPRKFARANDGGCQCTRYCGYTCKSSCNDDRECFWANGTCFETVTNQTGLARPRCGTF